MALGLLVLLGAMFCNEIRVVATVVLPLAGAILAGGSRARLRCVALLASLAALALAAVLVAAFPGGADEFAVFDAPWFGGGGGPVDVRFSIGLDGLSLWLFALASLLMVVAVLVSWEAIDQRASTFYRLLLMLETGLLGVFVARDIILFYVFFEFTLVPLYFLIGIWGSEHRREAAIKFFLFTLAGSVLTFLGLLAIVLWDHAHGPGAMTFSIPRYGPPPAAPDGRPAPASALRGPVRRVRRQDAALPAAHLAAAGPRRGPRGGKRDPRRRALEAGHLRLRPLRIADASGRRGRGDAVAPVALGGRDRLRGPGGAGPDRHQAAGGLFQRQPHGLLHVGGLCPKPPGDAGGVLR